MDDVPSDSSVPTPSVATTPVQPAAEAPALREDQISNAVAFLSHPKVRGLGRGTCVLVQLHGAWHASPCDELARLHCC